MIMDDRLEFADAAALSLAAPATHLLGDVVDLSVVRDIGVGNKDLYLVIQVDTTVTGGGGCTVQFFLASDDAAAIAVDGSASVHGSTLAIAVATLVAGYQIYIPVPRQGGTPYERYLGVIYTVGAAAVTAGKVNAFLTLSPPAWKAYDDGQIAI